MKYEVIRGHNPLLTQEMEDFNFQDPPVDPMELCQELLKTCYAEKGMGLAANQCGLPYRVFVMPASPEDIVMFNPRIVNVSEQQVLLEEGCLSFPNLIVKVKRPMAIRLRFTLPDGEVITKQFAGMTARVIQHELDHLNGILFYNRAHRYHRDKGFRDRDKHNKRLAQQAKKNVSLSPIRPV